MTKTGQFKERIDQAFNETIQGSVEGGVTVRADVSLVVQGVVAGPVVLEEDAILTVHGTFAGQVVSNEGILLVSGVCTVDPSLIEGPVGVFFGTILTAGSFPLQLLPDGGLRRLEGNNVNVSVDAQSVCYWDKKLDKFSPLTPTTGEDV